MFEAELAHPVVERGAIDPEDSRRPGDVARCYADPTFANRALNWKAHRGIEEMCVDSWRWQSQNPEGYAT